MSNAVNRSRLVGIIFLLFAMLVAAAIVGQVLWAGYQDRRVTLESEHANGLIAVRLLEEHATQTIKDAERNLDAVINAIHFAEEEKNIDDTLIRAILTKAQPFNRILKALQYVNPKGEAFVSSINYPAFQTDADDRIYVPYLLKHQEIKHAILGRPFQRFYDSELVVPIARNFFTSNGRYLGIISTDISVSYFSAVYARVAKDSKAIVSLFSNDGVVIVRFPFNSHSVGEDLSNSSAFQRLKNKPIEGFFEDSHFLDEKNTVPRLYTYRKIADYSITSVFARDLDSILSAWRSRNTDRIIFSTATISFIWILTFFLWIYIRRLNRIKESLLHSEAALKISETKFIYLFKHSPVPLALLSLNEAKFIEINESLQKQWHYVREDVIGKTTHELGIWEDLATREYFIQLLQNQGFIDQLEVRLCDKNGIAATCLLSARLFQSDGHDMVIFSPIDISRLREIEDEIRNLNIQLEERVMQRTLSLKHANQELEAALSAMRNMQAEMFRSEKMAALGYLVAGIAHELNTPIGNSLMVASTLKEHADQITMELSAQQPRRSVLGELNSETKKGVNILMRSLERAAQLIISFKQVAVDQSSNHRRSFDLSKTLEEVLTTLEMMYRPASHRLELDLEPGVQMDSYPGALAQILTNVISNAVTHGFENRQHGTMRLTTRRLHDLHVTLSFNDNGMGISSPDQARVFDPFFTTKLGQGGSGLGMHIVYNLVTEVLGGKIELSSALGVGTTFIIVLPLIAPNTPHKKEG